MVSDERAKPGLSGEDSLARWVSLPAVWASIGLEDGTKWAVGVCRLLASDHGHSGDYSGWHAQTVAALVSGDVVDREREKLHRES